MNNIKQQQKTGGAALLIFIIFFVLTSTLVVLGIGDGVTDDLVLYRTLESGKKSFYASEAGIEDAIYRYRTGKNYSSSESFTLAGVSVTATRTFVTDRYEFAVRADDQNKIRKNEAGIIVGDGVSFEFGLQGGNGGITQSNNSKVYGDVFSNGQVIGAGNATVYGDIVSAKSNGLISNIHATGSAWAHTISGSQIDKDAYYVSKVGTIVSGTSYPNSPDQATATFPISDALIQEWKQGITDTGTVIASTSAQCSSGTYMIQSDITLGNVKIDCNVHIKKQGASTKVTFTGPVWINGNLDFSSGPSIVASTSLGILSSVVMVDSSTASTTGGKISVNQSTDFTSGDAKSFVLLLSMNRSAEQGGTVRAIDVAQSANGKVLLYASHGRIVIGNSISLKEVTAYQIDVNNGATVIYEAGLASLVFKSVVAGYAITEWQEVK